MKHSIFAFVSAASFAMMVSACNGGSTGSVDNSKKPVLYGMKCEFVPDGQQAVIFGSNLAGAEVIFPDSSSSGIKVAADPSSSDSVLNVMVPVGSTSGKIKVIASGDTISSKFQFRDKRNLLIDFDSKRATWGGFDPYNENEDGEQVLATTVLLDSAVKLPAQLPEACSGNYALLFGRYNRAWSMSQSMYIQYVANPLDGGRGDHSVAGPFEGYEAKDLALKFEVFIPKESPYKKVHTEIFFGPYDAPDKHGRDRVPIYFWEPFANTGSYSTDGWQTITVPLSDFTHGVNSAEERFPTPINLKKSTNFSFVQFGDAVDSADDFIFMCLDNFRIVPIAE